MIENLFFRISRALNYALKAKGKHSIHSPILFNFLNVHLKNTSKNQDRNQRILNALITCFKIQSVWIEEEIALLDCIAGQPAHKNSADLVIVHSTSFLDKELLPAQKRQIIAILGLNKNSNNLKSFLHLKSTKQVIFSLDLWTIGILIYNYPSLKQDFILRYF
ncbi:MAG: hypothetical protein CMC18_07100 [Flavobacteriaceae bacterium]|nr:hypothetical protein [Flavobacteriaceae bacterium]